MIKLRWMRLLDRYLFRELLTPLIFCLCGFLIVGNAIQMFAELQQLQEHKLHFLDVLAYSLATMPEFLVTVLPVALLLALLFTLTNHARNNEITAMRAAGISLWRICVPYFVVGVAASAALFALNEMVVPRSSDWADRILNRYTGMQESKTQSLDFTNEREHRKWIVRQYQPGTQEMEGIQVEWKLPDGSSSVLYADRGIRTNGVWTFFNAQELSQPDPSANYVPVLRSNVLAMPEFNETPEEIRAELKVGAYLSFGKHDPDIPLKDIMPYLRWHPGLSRLDRGRLATELQERLAMPLTCLVVAFIAIPFGAAPGRRNLFFGVAGSIFIFFVYYVLQHIGVAFGSSGTWPAWLAAWLPNLFFSVLGLIMMIRIR